MPTDPSSQTNINTGPIDTHQNNKFIFEEIQGDLFVDAPENSSLAHCVSADFKMGRGIATIFRQKYNGVKELSNQHKKTGQVATLQRDNRIGAGLDKLPLEFVIDTIRKVFDGCDMKMTMFYL
ncbi:hypothetical protein C1645_755498 [Glomus cerebriforme]|uniref:Uncharacterized protein n=1 Tax=Glomus cerebriforme TaxID=658196 RepID=A0A397TH57_9GLOM|nr:hypothetical protein C1645_755498 [Glomus cerebriforme]